MPLSRGDFRTRGALPPRSPSLPASVRGLSAWDSGPRGGDQEGMSERLSPEHLSRY